MDRCHVSDRHFFYLDHVWVKQQLDQLEQPVRDEVLRRTTSQEGGVSATAKLPLADIDLGGSRKRQSTVEVHQQAGDTPERIFARYYDHVTRDGRLTVSPSGPLVPGQRYELYGQLDLGRDMLVTKAGAEIAIQLASQYWRHDDDASGIQLAVFGICLRDNSLRVMAAYIPDSGEPALASIGRRVPRRRVLAGAVGVAALIGGGVAAWPALTRKGLNRFRIAGGPTEFFHDPAVQDVFRSKGLDVQQTEFGSAQILTIDHDRYDAVFPATINTARQIQSKWGPGLPQAPSFGSPMAILSWAPVVEMLAELKIAEQRDGIWVFKVADYLDSVDLKVRWPRLYGTERMLLETTDPATSGSAQMFIAILSRVANGDNTVTNPADVPRLAQRFRACFDDLGIKHRTTADLLKAYDDGPAVVPMLFAYENDAVHQFRPAEGMVFLYPTPNVRSEHHFVLLNQHPEGERVGRLLRSDPELIRIAQQQFGFRYGVDRSEQFVRLADARGITVPTNGQLGELVLGELPSEQILGSFVDALKSPQKSPA